MQLISKVLLEVARTGQFFTVTFVKKNGEVRTMNARVTSPKELTVVQGKDGGSYLTVKDNTKKEFRNINLDSIVEIRAGGITVFNTKSPAKAAEKPVKVKKEPVLPPKGVWLKNPGKMPVSGNTLVEVKLNKGLTIPGWPASDWGWSIWDGDYCIAEYRVM